MIIPRVSVVIPNYNHGVYLKQRIDSVLRQTFRDFEIIILDDCSTDNSREIINRYAGNPSISKIIFNDKNSGTPFRQWKHGISEARGEWIWIAESDDYADEFFLEKMMTAVNDSSNIGLVYCDSLIVGNNGISSRTFASIKNTRFNTSRWSERHTNSGVLEIEDYLLHEGTINNTSAVLFHKKTLLSADPFDLDLRYIGDKYAFIKVLARSDIAYVNESLNYYRDPFNSRQADKYVFYFYEQFMVFDWVYRNIRIPDRGKFLRAFYANTRNSLFRDWNTMKLSMYIKLFRLNPYLLLKSILHNFIAPFKDVFNTQHISRPSDH